MVLYAQCTIGHQATTALYLIYNDTIAKGLHVSCFNSTGQLLSHGQG